MEFISRFRLYEFTDLPLGLCNAPSAFHCLINHVFSIVIDQYVLVYLDSILVFSEIAYDHEVFS